MTQIVDSDLLTENQVVNGCTITKAYIAKVGFINLCLKDHSPSTLLKKENDVNTLSEDCKIDIYKCLEESEFVFNIEPHIEEENGQEKTDLDWISGKGFFYSNYFWKMKILIPQRKRSGIFDDIFYESWKPEEFTLYFNGCIFLSLSEVNKVPTGSDIGQIGRELLRKTLEKSNMFDVGKVGPSPLHPKAFFLFIKAEEYDALEQNIIKFQNDLYVFVPETELIDDVIEDFLWETGDDIYHFYMVQILRSKLFTLVHTCNRLNRLLGRQVLVYFSQSFIARIFCSNVSNTIRKIISRMHLILNMITSTKIEYDESGKDSLKAIENNAILCELKDYFKSQIEEQVIDFDINSYLTTMSFASKETSDLAIIKITLIASLIGGVIGGISTYILYIALK